jgi:hypothetical protein
MDDTDIDPSIAAAMGFGSFGNQAKKRKFNDDAFTGTSKPGKKDSSGANTTELGVRQKMQPATIDGEDAARAKKEKHKGSAPSGLAAFLQRAKEIPDPPPPITGTEKLSSASGNSLLPNVSLPPRLVANASLPPKPVRSLKGSHVEPGKGLDLSREDLYALSKGVKNERGDTYYFLPSFVEDPWRGWKGERGGLDDVTMLL